MRWIINFIYHKSNLQNMYENIINSACIVFATLFSKLKVNFSVRLKKGTRNQMMIFIKHGGKFRGQPCWGIQY